MALELMNAEPKSDTAVSTADLFPEGSIRLAEISVFDWGTFNGLHTGKIDPQGTLISGHTGAGKSSFVDALQPLFLPAGKCHFNVAAAQGGEKDRTSFTYFRGRLGSVDDSSGRTAGKYKRPRDFLSSMRALFRTEAGHEITLAALFWGGPDATSLAQVSRGYVVAHRNISLKELLDAIRGSQRNSIRWDNLSGHFKGQQGVHTTQSFEAYAEWYRDALWLEDAKAPSLLIRAMGLKRIEDLTTLVRELVLEETDTRDKAEESIKEFQSLKAIHAELVDARRRRDALTELPERIQQRERDLAIKDGLQKEYNVLPAWHAADAVRLLDSVIADDIAAVRLNEQLSKDAGLAVKQRQDAYGEAIALFKAVGGDNLESLENDHRRARDLVEERGRHVNELRTVLTRLQLKPPAEGWTEQALSEMKAHILDHLNKTATEVRTLRDEQINALVAQQEAKQKSDVLKSELAELMEKKDSNIDAPYLRLRKMICEATGVPVAELPYIGELIDVKESEAVWRGAIERALGFVRLRLVVDPRHHEAIRSFVNSRSMGRRVGYVVAHPFDGVTPFQEESFLRKLEWGKSPFREWLKRYLVDHHLACVNSADAMEGRPFSMTVNGLIQRKLNSYDKDDTHDIADPRFWYLGFNNEARKAAVHEQYVQLLQIQHERGKRATEIDTLVRLRETHTSEGQKALEFDWASIDVQGARDRVGNLEDAITQMKARNVDLAAARQMVEESRGALNGANDAAQDAAGKLGIARETLTRHQGQMSIQSARAVKILDSSVEERLAGRFDPMERSDIDRIDAVEHARAGTVNGHLGRATQALTTVERLLGEIMANYRGKFPDASSDLPQRSADDVAEFTRILNEWSRHFEELVSGRLPDLVERFENSLNLQTMQSLTTIRQKIRAQREDIIERIEQINTVLERTEITNGRHLSLIANDLHDESARLFDEQMMLALRLAAGSDREAHFRALEDLIKMLERATNPQTRGNKDTRAQLDSRYRMEFSVREWRPPAGKTYRCALEERETVFTHRDTKGKSGGEKEGFSGLVVASALAYVLTPKGAPKPSYCSVFLDEAFSNTSDSLAMRVLKVFRELGLHLNLITPYKNVELARVAVRSALVVDKDGDDESRLSEMSWQEIDRQRLLAEKEDGPMRAAASLLNVRFEATSTP